MDKLLEFLPSLIGLACIALISWFFLWRMSKKYKEELKSITWCRENKKKIFLTMTIPLGYLYAPALEELIFRAPLVLFFDNISDLAWQGIFVSATLFGICHWGKNTMIPSSLFVKSDSGEQVSDSLEEEIKRLQETNKKIVLVQRVVHVSISFGVGVMIGYYSIVYQSIWVAFLIHSLWNIFAPTLFSLLFALFVLAGLAVINIYHVWKDIWNRITGRNKHFESKWTEM